MAENVIGSAFVRLDAKLKEFEQNLTKAEGRLKAFGEHARKVGVAMTAAGAAVLGGLGLIVKSAAGFEKAMKEVQAVTNATEKEMEKLSAIARSAGLSLGFSPTSVAKAMYYLGSAGYDANEIMESLNGILLLARATNSDLAFATQAVVNTLNMFSLSAKEAGRVADVYASAIAGSQATLEKLSQSMVYAGPVANSLGFSLEDVTAVLMKMYNAGYQGSMAGTALRAAFSRLAKPTDEAAQLILALGLELYNETTLSAQARSKADALREAFERQTDTIRALVNDYKVFNVHIDRLTGYQDDYALRIEEQHLLISAIRQRAAEEGRKLTEKEIDQIKKQEIHIGGLRLVYDELAFKKHKLAQQSNEVAEALEIERNKEAKLKKALQEALAVYEASPKALKDMGTLFDELSTKTEGIAHLVTLFGQEAAPAMSVAIEGGREAFMGYMKQLEGTNQAQQMSIIQMQAFTSAVNELKAILGSLWIDIGNQLLPILKAMAQNISGVISKILEWTKEHPKLTSAIIKFVAIAGGVMAILGPLLIILPGIIAAIPILAAVFSPLGLAITACVIAGAAIIAQWEEMKEGLDVIWDALKTFGGWVVDYYVGCWTLLKDLLQGALDFILGWHKMWFKAGEKIFTAFWDGLKSVWTHIWDWLKEVVEKLKFWESDPVVHLHAEEMLKAGRDLMSGLAQGIAGSSGLIRSAMAGAIGGLKPSFALSPVVAGAAIDQRQVTVHANFDIEKLDPSVNLEQLANDLHWLIKRRGR